MAKKVSHGTLNPYPTDLNEPANIMLDKITGGDVPLACAVHAAYQIQGVALSRLLPDEDNGPPAAKGAKKGDIWDRPDGMKCPSECDEDECVDALKDAAGKKGVKGPLSDALLVKLLAAAMKYLSEWLKFDLP